MGTPRIRGFACHACCALEVVHFNPKRGAEVPIKVSRDALSALTHLGTFGSTFLDTEHDTSHVGKNRHC